MQDLNIALSWNILVSAPINAQAADMSQDKKDDSTSKQGGQTQRIVAITGLVGAFAALFTAIGAPDFFPSLIKTFLGSTSSEGSSEVGSTEADEPSGLGSTSSVDTPSPTLSPSPTPISEPTPAPNPPTSQTPTGNQDIEPIKLKIERVTVEDDNSYSSIYGPEKTIDNNISSGNYWSTENGAIIEVSLNFFLEEISTVNKIHFISTRNNGSYTQPQSLDLAFINESGEKVEERTIQVKTPNTQWERNDFDPVANVSMIRLQLLDPLNDTGSYMTLNEVQFYGFPFEE